MTPPAGSVRNHLPKIPAAFRAFAAGHRTSRAARDLTCVLVGRGTAIAANAALMLILAQRLDLGAYGLLVTIISAQLLLSRVLLLGVETGIVRLRTVLVTESAPDRVTQAGLLVILYSSIALTLTLSVALVLLPAIRSAPWLIVLSSIVVGAVGTAFVDYTYAFWLSRLSYRTAALTQGSASIGRLFLTLLALHIAGPALGPVAASYMGASLVFGVALAAAVTRVIGFSGDRSLIPFLVRYSLWACIANVIVILGLYEGTFLLTALERQAATGAFGLALTFSLGFFAVYNGYSDYLLPRAARVESRTELLMFVRGAYGAAFLLILCSSILCWGIGRFLAHVLKPEMLDVIPVFYVLALSMIVLFLQAPLEAVTHYALRPQLVTLAWAVRALSIALLALVWAPDQGAPGMAYAQLGGSVTGLAVLSFALVTALALDRRPTSPTSLVHPPNI